ncbi:MAG: glutamate synthase-related protein [Planctomycetota bacterium]
MYSAAKSSRAVGATNRLKDDISPFSGLCVTCVETCTGLCEVGMSAIRGSEVIYPIPFGNVTAASQKDYPVHWGDFSILGTAAGAKGVKADSDAAIFPNVDLEIELGAGKGKPGIRCKLPITIPGLGSTDIARKNWPALAAGAALSGVLLTVGENVVGMDREAKIVKGRVTESPALRSRVEHYRRWQQGGAGTLVVQENVEDNRLGVLEYAIEKLGVTAVEMKWGQGAKDIGGEVKITDVEQAQMLKQRGYVVLPDPTDPEVVEAFQRRAFGEFERHSRLGMVSEEGFAKRAKDLRAAGAKHLFLKTGAYRFEDLARALAFASKYGVDVLTIDAAGGGTGMSPWRMMNEWGIPPIELFSKTHEYATRLRKAGKHLPDLVFAGGFALEDHIFKGLALGSPYVKAIGMARGPLTACTASAALWYRIAHETEQALVERFGRTKQEVFLGSLNLLPMIGKKGIDECPAGGLGVFTYLSRVEQGLKQIMAGARKFKMSEAKARPSREDLVALTHEAAEISGIPFTMEHDRKTADGIIEAAL